MLTVAKASMYIEKTTTCCFQPVKVANIGFATFFIALKHFITTLSKKVIIKGY
ncbi:hypothetical protein RV03_GL002439 [Enterococcus gallinarum]|nr:hypothetical protein RV03_GL002439 [Enterococcus gallinarum]